MVGMTALSLGALIGTKCNAQEKVCPISEAVRYFLFEATGVNNLSNFFPFSTLSFGFSTDSDGISIDAETGEVRISSQALADGIAVTVKASDTDGNVSTHFDFNIGLTALPEAPIAADALEDVIVPFGSDVIIVDAAADFSGESLNFTVSGVGATIDPSTGLVTIATDTLLSDEQITVTASNPGGSASSTFRVSVTAVEPVATIAPRLVGSGKVGSPVTLEAGSWTGAPLPEFALQWLLEGIEISGAMGNTYIPANSDDRKTLSCRVVATNAGGSAKVITEPLTITQVAPELTGILEDISAEKGDPTISVRASEAFEGADLRYAVSGANAVINEETGEISLATDQVMTAAEVTVTAENSGGSAEAIFEVTIATKDVLPILLSMPVLVGQATIGQAITLDAGLWGGRPAPELTLQWLCDGAEVAGETAKEYIPKPVDDLKTIACRVTATNMVGSAEAVTNTLSVTYAPPVVAGELLEEIFDQHTGTQFIETAAGFTGENLSFSVEGAKAEIDPETGVVSLSTETAFDGEIVTVSATNSGGTVSSAFQVTVEPVEAGKPLPLQDDEWGLAASSWTPANQAATFQPRVRIDPTLSVYAAQWTTSGYAPALERHWETLVPTDETHEFTTGMLNQGTGDWHIFQQGDSRNSNFRIRYKTSEASEWSDESGKREVLPPPPVVPPAEVANWTVDPGELDGQIIIAIDGTEPASWGDDGSGVIQWRSSTGDWTDVPSATFTAELDEALHGHSTTIKVRALGSAGTSGPETETSVKVPGPQVVTEDIWYPALLVGQDALNKGLGNGYREGKGGEHYQFFHGGDVHRLYPDDYITIMDVHHIWYTRNARDEFPTYHVPEGRGITSRYGIACKFDPEYPGQWVAVCASRNPGANNVGGLFRTEDHGQSYPHKETGLYVVGGQAQSGRQFRAWSRTLIWNNQNYNEWLFVNRWYGGNGGETMRSTDRGRTWSVANTYFRSNQLSRIYTVAQDADGKVWVGSENGIHSSTNFGKSWSNGTRPKGIPSGWVVGIECHPTDAAVAYVAVYDKGVYRTTDGFQSFVQISPGNNSYCNVFASPYDFNKVWILSLHKSPKNGSDTGVRPQFSANGLAKAPKWDSLGTLNTKTYGWPQGPGDSNPSATGNRNNLMQGGVNPLDIPGTNAAIGHFKARHFSTRNGYTFTNAADGVEHAGAGDMNADGIAFHPTNPDIACVCAFDKGGLITRNGWRSFSRMGHGAGGAPADIAGSGTGGFSPDNNNDFVITTGDYNSYSARITRNATSNTPSWATINPILNDKVGSDPWCRFLKYCPVPGHGNIIYSDHFRSTNNGGSWVDLRNKSGWPGGGYDAHVFACSYTDPKVLYALNGKMDAVYRSDNQGESWYHYVNLGTSVSLAQGHNKAVAIDVSPLDHNKILWWNRGVGLQEYDGKTKRTMLTNPKNWDQMWRCKYSHNYPGLFYVQCQLTGDGTIWRTVDNGASFTEINKHLPRSGAIRSIVICPHTDILYSVGTIGTRYFPPPTLNDLAEERLQNYRDWWSYDRTWITATYGY